MQPAQDSVVKEVRINARPETIFPFFTDPAFMVRWKGVSAELDPRPGGVYRVNVTGQNIASGRYVEIVPHTRVVFTWGWEDDHHAVPPGASMVEVTLIPDGDGATIVRLRHSGLASQELRDQHATGWTHYLDRLAIAAVGKDPGPDPLVGSTMN
jgi:uncharacterized protein YndB with AHSA1/START domain